MALGGDDGGGSPGVGYDGCDLDALVALACRDWGPVPGAMTTTVQVSLSPAERDEVIAALRRCQADRSLTTSAALVIICRESTWGIAR